MYLERDGKLVPPNEGDLHAPTRQPWPDDATDMATAHLFIPPGPAANLFGEVELLDRLAGVRIVAACAKRVDPARQQLAQLLEDEGPAGLLVRLL